MGALGFLKMPELAQAFAQHGKAEMDPGGEPVKHTDMRREQDRAGTDEQPSLQNRQKQSRHAGDDQGPASNLPNQSACVKIQGVTMI